MKKLFLAATLVLSLSVCCACSNSKKDDTKATTKVAASKTASESTTAASTGYDVSKNSEFFEALKSSGAFTDDMSESTEKVVATLMHLEEGSYASISCLKGTGATAEEVTLIEATAGSDINAKITSYLDSQKTSYESYLPEEVPKLENAIVKQSGNYYLLVVAADNDKATSVIETYFN